MIDMLSLDVEMMWDSWMEDVEEVRRFVTRLTDDKR